MIIHLPVAWHAAMEIDVPGQRTGERRKGERGQAKFARRLRRRVWKIEEDRAIASS
jgi:hypothetical protein